MDVQSYSNEGQFEMKGSVKTASLMLENLYFIMKAVGGNIKIKVAGSDAMIFY